jgi:minor extracellular serine protease Vpr
LAQRALTAGASTAPHFIGAPVTVTGFSTFGAASGDFATVSSNLTAPLGAVLSGTSLSTACSALPGGSLTGKIALISRGVCTFSTKIRNAQNAGAIAVLVRNNVAGDPVAMAQDGTANQPTVPAYMLSRSNGDAIKLSGGASTTIGATKQYFQTANSDIMAGFSSRGPTDVDFRVKPDVVAPGVNVLSSIPAAFCAAAPCWAFFQGTSMATPHLAGSAAVVLGQHPSWSAAEVRSAIVNTADTGVLKNFSTGASETNVNVIGAGRENLLAAVNAKVALDPVSVSFGAVPAGSGQSKTATVDLSTLSGSGPYAVSVGTSTGTGVSYAASLSGNTITVTMNADKGATIGFHQATLTVSKAGEVIAHAVVFTFIKQ